MDTTHTPSTLLNVVNLGAVLITAVFGWVLEDLDLVLSIITKFISIATFIIFFFINKDTFFKKVGETMGKIKKKK
jgi:hypothetical protein